MHDDTFFRSRPKWKVTKAIFVFFYSRENDKRLYFQTKTSLFDASSPNNYRVSHFKVPQSKSILKYVISIFMIFYGAYYVHHIIPFCFLPYFSKEKIQRGAQFSFKNVAKYFQPNYQVGVKCYFLKIAYIYPKNDLKKKISKKNLKF